MHAMFASLGELIQRWNLGLGCVQCTLHEEHVLQREILQTQPLRNLYEILQTPSLWIRLTGFNGTRQRSDVHGVIWVHTKSLQDHGRNFAHYAFEGLQMMYENKLIANPDYIAEHTQTARDVAAAVNCKVCDEVAVMVVWTSLLLVTLCM